MVPVDVSIKSIRINMPECELKGSGVLAIPIAAGVYDLTRDRELNSPEWKLHLPDGGQVTVDDRIRPDGRAQVS